MPMSTVQPSTLLGAGHTPDWVKGFYPFTHRSTCFGSPYQWGKYVCVVIRRKQRTTHGELAGLHDF